MKYIVELVAVSLVEVDAESEQEACDNAEFDWESVEQITAKVIR